MNSIILRIFKSTLVVPSNLCFKSSSKVLLLLLPRFLLENVSWTLCIRAITWFQNCQEKWFSFSLIFFSVFRTYCSVENSKKKAAQMWKLNLRFLKKTCFTFFTSQWHSKTAYKSEVFTGNNFQNKAQWFDSFMCCFCCFFRRGEFF